MIAKLCPAIKAFAAIALSGIILTGCAFDPKEATEPISQPPSIAPPALSEPASQSDALSSQTEESEPLPASSAPSSEPDMTAEALPQLPEPVSSVPEAPESSFPEPPTELFGQSSAMAEPLFADPPMVKSALLKKGVPNGFGTPPGAVVAETTIHIEATIQDPVYQRYNFILSLEDIPTPLILGTYKSTVIPNQGTQVSLSVPLELSREEFALIDSIDASKITLTIVGVDKEEHTMPSVPLYLDADKTSFIPQDKPA